MKIYVKKVQGVTLPEKGSQVAAGYDIVATSDPKIVGHTVDNVLRRIDYIEYETSLFIAPSSVSFHTLIHPRSSVSKYNLVLANSIGLVDNDYRGMVICRFKYVLQPEDLFVAPDGLFGVRVNMDKLYKKGDKIAQLVAEQTVTVEWELVDDLTQTQRGEGGFGSTGGLADQLLSLKAESEKVGKPLVEVFAEEKKKFEERKAGTAEPVPSILDKFKKTVEPTIPAHVPYSERIKQRDP